MDSLHKQFAQHLPLLLAGPRDRKYRTRHNAFMAIVSHERTLSLRVANAERRELGEAARAEYNAYVYGPDEEPAAPAYNPFGGGRPFADVAAERSLFGIKSAEYSL